MLSSAADQAPPPSLSKTHQEDQDDGKPSASGAEHGSAAEGNAAASAVAEEVKISVAQSASSMDRRPDTPPPLSPPRSPLPAASAEGVPPDAGAEPQELPEDGAAHQRRPSDDAESTASTSHAQRDASAILPQELDTDSFPTAGTSLLQWLKITLIGNCTCWVWNACQACTGSRSQGGAFGSGEWCYDGRQRGRMGACAGVDEVDVSALDGEAARALAAEQQAALRARELQLERKFQEVAAMQDLTQQLMVRQGPLSVCSPADMPSVYIWRKHPVCAFSFLAARFIMLALLLGAAEILQPPDLVKSGQRRST